MRTEIWCFPVLVISDRVDKYRVEAQNDSCHPRKTSAPSFEILFLSIEVVKVLHDFKRLNLQRLNPKWINVSSPLEGKPFQACSCEIAALEENIKQFICLKINHRPFIIYQRSANHSQSGLTVLFSATTPNGQSLFSQSVSTMSILEEKSEKAQ